MVSAESLVKLCVLVVQCTCWHLIAKVWSEENGSSSLLVEKCGKKSEEAVFQVV